ncbi:MAG: DUF2283 domain-containing protein [Candidatus Nanohaloarchaea archaeon]
MNEHTVTYDYGADLLWVRGSREIESSITLGNLTVDFGDDGEVVGLELLNASQGMYFDAGDDEDTVDLLGQVEEAELVTRKTASGIFLVLKVFDQQGQELALMTASAPRIDV